MSTYLVAARAAIQAQIDAGHTSATLNNAACMAAQMDLSAIGAWGGGWPFTLVANATKGIFQFAVHIITNPDNTISNIVGQTLVCGANSYTITAQCNISNTDLGFVVVDRQVTGVNPMAVLPASGAKWSGTMLGTPGIWIIARDNRIQLQSETILDSAAGYVGTQVDSTSGWTIGTTLVGGNSSSPLIGVLPANADGTGAITPILLCCATSPASGSSIVHSLSAIETKWALATGSGGLGVTDHYTRASFAIFDDYTDPNAGDPAAFGFVADGTSLNTVASWTQDDGSGAVAASRLPNAGDDVFVDHAIAEPSGGSCVGATMTITGVAHGTYNCIGQMQLGGTLSGGNFTFGSCGISLGTYITGGTWAGQSSTTNLSFYGGSQSVISGGEFFCKIDLVASSNHGTITPAEGNVGPIFHRQVRISKSPNGYLYGDYDLLTATEKQLAADFAKQQTLTIEQIAAGATGKWIAADGSQVTVDGKLVASGGLFGGASAPASD